MSIQTCEDGALVAPKGQLTVLLEGHPPTVNHMYRRCRRGVFKTKEASTWEALAILEVRQAAQRHWGTYDLERFKGLPLALEISVARDGWKGKTKAKRGLYVRPDVSNFIKAAEDAVCRALGLDDSAVVELVAKKLVSGRAAHTIIVLRFI